MGGKLSSNVNKTCAIICISCYKFNGKFEHVLQKCEDEYLYVKDHMNSGVSFKLDISPEELCEFLLKDIKNNFTSFYISANFVEEDKIEYNLKNMDEARPVLLNLLKLIRNVNSIEQYLVE